ncbi:MAG: nucleotidyltransferase domain-containing protein [Myxococcota bacterium]
MDFDLPSHTHLLTIAGSRAYGIHRPGSDVDLKGVAIAPARYVLGFAHRFEQADDASHIDAFRDRLTPEEQAATRDTKLEGSVYELRKFLSLAADNNPNILDALFCREEEVRACSPIGRALRDHRHLFLSAKAKHTFSGYAAAQLKRIKGHRAWLLDPPQAPPTRAQYGLPEHTLLPSDQLAAANAAVRKQIDSWELDLSGLADAEIVHVVDQLARCLSEIRSALGYESVEAAKYHAAARTIGLDENLIYVMQREREYESAARHFAQYSEWKRSRNPARAALEAAHGYDTKHAGHLVRLLRMGFEILTTGEVHVWRGPGGPNDADELIAIRSGEWSYDALIAWADRQEAELDRVYAERRYVVPARPDREAIDALCVDWMRTALQG